MEFLTIDAVARAIAASRFGRGYVACKIGRRAMSSGVFRSGWPLFHLVDLPPSRCFFRCSTISCILLMSSRPFFSSSSTGLWLVEVPQLVRAVAVCLPIRSLSLASTESSTVESKHCVLVFGLHQESIPHK